MRRRKRGDLVHLDLSFSSFLVIFDSISNQEFEHWMATGRNLVCAVSKDDFEMLLSEIVECDCNTFGHNCCRLDFDIPHYT